MSKTPHEEAKEHPAYGVISWSRQTHSGGKANLFGSEMSHHDVICVKISRAIRSRSTHRDWVCQKDGIAEVLLSPAQFTEFLTTPNTSPGAQCTISWTEKDGKMPALESDSRYQVFKAEIAEDMANIEEGIDNLLVHAEEVLRRKAVRKADIHELKGQIQSLRMNLFENVPFLKESMEEHMQETVSRAKEEVEAYIQGRVASAGLEAIRREPTMLKHEPETIQNKNPLG